MHPPCIVAPPPVSTAADAPQAVANAPLRPPAVAAVLTIFEGQAVYRIIGGDASEFPDKMLFRLRRGMRIPTGGTR